MIIELIDETVYRVIGITGTTEDILGEEQWLSDAHELIDYYENYYDWVGIIEIPI
jgi:hypothetical protein